MNTSIGKLALGDVHVFTASASDSSLASACLHEIASRLLLSGSTRILWLDLAHRFDIGVLAAYCARESPSLDDVARWLGMVDIMRLATGNELSAALSSVMWRHSQMKRTLSTTKHIVVIDGLNESNTTETLETKLIEISKLHNTILVSRYSSCAPPFDILRDYECCTGYEINDGDTIVVRKGQTQEEFKFTTESGILLRNGGLK